MVSTKTIRAPARYLFPRTQRSRRLSLAPSSSKLSDPTVRISLFASCTNLAAKTSCLPSGSEVQFRLGPIPITKGFQVLPKISNGWAGGRVAVALLVAIHLLASDIPLFPTPLHLVRRVEDPIASSSTEI